MVSALYDRGAYSFSSKKLELSLKNRVTPPARILIEEPPVLESKALPYHFQYELLGFNNTLSIIIVAYLMHTQYEALISILKRFKRPIKWTIINIIEIPHKICTHKILLEWNCAPSVHCCLNPSILEVVKKMIISG